MRSFFLIVCVLLTLPVQAQTPDFCTLLKQKESVIYTPGISVDGKPVASAHLNDQSDILPQRIVVPLTVDIAREFGLNMPSLEAQGQIGTLEITGNQVFLNGRDLSDKAQILCKPEGEITPVPEVKQMQSPVSTEEERDVIFGQSGNKTLNTYND